MWLLLQILNPFVKNPSSATDFTKKVALGLIIFVDNFWCLLDFRCIKHLQKQATPTGVEMRDDEFIIHVEGTASSQRIVRHIGGTSWPGTLPSL